jgi:hypothetical protein
VTSVETVDAFVDAISDERRREDARVTPTCSPGLNRTPAARAASHLKRVDRADPAVLPEIIARSYRSAGLD